MAQLDRLPDLRLSSFVLTSFVEGQEWVSTVVESLSELLYKVLDIMEPKNTRKGSKKASKGGEEVHSEEEETDTETIATAEVEVDTENVNMSSTSSDNAKVLRLTKNEASDDIIPSAAVAVDTAKASAGGGGKGASASASSSVSASGVPSDVKSTAKLNAAMSIAAAATAPMAMVVDAGDGSTCASASNGSGKRLRRTDEDIRVAVNLWCSDHAAAEERYGRISEWDVSCMTNISTPGKRYTALQIAHTTGQQVVRHGISTPSPSISRYRYRLRYSKRTKEIANVHFHVI